MYYNKDLIHIIKGLLADNIKVDHICRIEVKKWFKLNILILHFETQLYVMSAHTSGVMKWRGIKIISSREKF